MKFVTPVSMKGTQEELETLIPKVKELGYQLCGKFEKGDQLIATNYTARHNKFVFLASGATTNERHYIAHFNPELFLALAAQTDLPEGIEGEWWMCTKTTPRHTQSQIYRANRVKRYHTITPHISTDDNAFNSFPINVYKDYTSCFRKATKEELIAYFTKPKEKEWVLPEKWCVRPRNREELRVVCKYFDERRHAAGITEERNFYTKTDYDKNGNPEFYWHYANRGVGHESNVWTTDPDIPVITFEQFEKYVLNKPIMKRDIKSLSRQEVIFCATKEEDAQIVSLLQQLKKERKSNWNACRGYAPNEEGICYSTSGWSRRGYFEEQGYIIYPASDFLTQTNTQTMEKKIIGYNLKSFVDSSVAARTLDTNSGLCPGGYWLPAEGEVFENAKRLQLLDIWFEPVYEPEKPQETTLTLGRQNDVIKVRKNGTILVNGKHEIECRQVKIIANKFSGVIGCLHGFDVSLPEFDIHKRQFRIGCASENHLFSLNELNMVVEAYEKLQKS